MELLGNLFGPHLNRLNRAMELTSQRHSLLTNNLANVNTPGYKRMDMDFNLQMDDAMGRIQEKMESLNGDRVTRDEGAVRIDGNSVDLEKEVMMIAETELRYQALTDMTASYFQGMKNVIREGR